jgi:hypothetical protein
MIDAIAMFIAKTDWSGGAHAAFVAVLVVAWVLTGLFRQKDAPDWPPRGPRM